MLKCGFLAGTSIYICSAHTKNIFDEYAEKLDVIFALIADCENGRDVMSMLDGPVCHEGFKRLN